MRKAFTLLEMLIVVGILGILMTIVTVNFGSARESARALQCLSNLRDLANAATDVAMSSGQYPCAGSQWVGGMETGSVNETPVEGWVGWGLDNKPVPFNGTDRYENDLHAITNGGSYGSGLFWKAVRHNRRIYSCPTFLNAYRDISKKDPLWTYVMNGAGFSYDYSKGTLQSTKDWQGVVENGGSGIDFGKLVRPDRTLMFAELPHPTRSGVNMVGDLYLGDGILQTEAKIEGKHYGNGSGVTASIPPNNDYWVGTPESIGFVHKTNAGKYCAHVVFADCHVEKIAEPTKGKGLTPEEISAVLCAGDDYAYDKNGYRLVSKADEEAAQGENTDTGLD